MKRQIYGARGILIGFRITDLEAVEVCRSTFPLSSGNPHLPQQSGIECSNPIHAHGQAVCFAASQGHDGSETCSPTINTPTWY